MAALENAASPCVRICRLGEAQVCLGCGRHVTEIAEWPAAAEPRRREIIGLAAARLAAIIRKTPEPQA